MDYEAKNKPHEFAREGVHNWSLNKLKLISSCFF